MTNPSGNTTDGYTSGAINSDEDPYNLGSISGTEPANEADPLFTVGKAVGHSGALDQSGSHTPASGSGYSPTDYQPLSVLRHEKRSTANTASPPRKRRKLMSKPGKVMKDAYFKGIQWTRTFVTGPLDPIHIKYEFYCMLCKTYVSTYSKGAREILRPYKSEGHLRRDQKWRFVHLQETDSTTGVVTHQVRREDGYVLTPLELEREKPHFIDVPLVDAGDHFPFYEEYLASLGGITNPDDLRLTTLISLIGSFVPHRGNLALLQSLWTRVGSFTNHRALFTSFDWSSASLTVSYFPSWSSFLCPFLVSKNSMFQVYASVLFHFRRSSITSSHVDSRTLPNTSLPLTCILSSSPPKVDLAACPLGFGKETLSFELSFTAKTCLNPPLAVIWVRFHPFSPLYLPSPIWSASLVARRWYFKT